MADDNLDNLINDLTESASKSPGDSESQDTSAVTATSEADSDSSKGPSSCVAHILSMKVPIIVRVAQKRVALSDILKLNMGSIIQFDKDAYQNVDLMVNNTTIGLGQPVKIGEKFGLRITQVGELEDTIKSLGGEGDQGD